MVGNDLYLHPLSETFPARRRLTAPGSTFGHILLNICFPSPICHPMKTAKKPCLVVLLTLALASLVTGCIGPKADSAIPWNRPADWEGRIPGMGQQ